MRGSSMQASNKRVYRCNAFLTPSRDKGFFRANCASPLAKRLQAINYINMSLLRGTPELARSCSLYVHITMNRIYSRH